MTLTNYVEGEKKKKNLSDLALRLMQCKTTN